MIVYIWGFRWMRHDLGSCNPYLNEMSFLRQYFREAQNFRGIKHDELSRRPK